MQLRSPNWRSPLPGGIFYVYAKGAKKLKYHLCLRPWTPERPDVFIFIGREEKEDATVRKGLVLAAGLMPIPPSDEKFAGLTLQPFWPLHRWQLKRSKAYGPIGKAVADAIGERWEQDDINRSLPPGVWSEVAVAMKAINGAAPSSKEKRKLRARLFQKGAADKVRAPATDVANRATTS